MLARAPLNRAMRASARITDASHALDNDVNAFMTNLVQLMQSVEKRRAVDVSRAEEQLRASVAARKSETEALEARSQSERLGRLKGALRLARSWKGAQLTGQREADALIALLRSELSHMEAAWDADKLRRDAESEAQGEASRNAIAKLQEEARLAEEALRQEHMEAIAQAEVEHEEVLSKLSEELERERGLREGLEASLAKALADAEREITRLQTEVSGYRNYSSTANYALQANTRKLREEKEELQKEADAKLRREREAALFRQKSLEEEVKRLRSVQEDVLVQGGALPGGEVRQYLFLEATKTRAAPAGREHLLAWAARERAARARTQRAREPSRDHTQESRARDLSEVSAAGEGAAIWYRPLKHILTLSGLTHCQPGMSVYRAACGRTTGVRVKWGTAAPRRTSSSSCCYSVSHSARRSGAHGLHSLASASPVAAISV